MKNMEQQVKSKQRVADHGEVFTAEREVKAMCDLVKQETERIDSRFLEMKTPRLIQFNYSSAGQPRGYISVKRVHFTGRVKPGCFCYMEVAA